MGLFDFNCINLHIYVVLKHILDRGETHGAQLAPITKQCSNKVIRENFINNERLLDLSGPKLIEGLPYWNIFYQAIGVVNLRNRPLYVSIIFKLTLICLITYQVIVKAFRLYEVVIPSFKNPIVVFINLLSAASMVSQFVASTRLNLLKLGPCFKILTSDKLCFLKVEMLDIFCSSTLRATVLFIVYQSIILYLLDCKDWQDFLNNFNIGRLVIEIFTSGVWLGQLFGMTQFDYYIRCCFAHWLLSLKSQLELQFSYLHSDEQMDPLQPGHRASRVPPSPLSSSGPSSKFVASSSSSLCTLSRDRSKLCNRFITFDEVQRSLNNMDDHLEVSRSVQTGSLVFTTLNSFFATGTVILVGYRCLVNQADTYHGTLLLLTAANSLVITFFSYAGDSFVNYALSSLVQTVEDEYFTSSRPQSSQADRRALNVTEASTEDARAEVKRQPDKVANTGPTTAQDRGQPDASCAHKETSMPDGLSLAELELKRRDELLIKRSDVLFCREFLHQFENHLATPWSKLTLKSHLHILRTFVTLVAAQIIFEHEL